MSNYDMDISHQQLPQHLKKNLLSRYWLQSDDAFLRYDTQQLLNETFKAKGFEIKPLILSSTADWAHLEALTCTADLFSPKRCIVVDASSLKLSASFARQWQSICQQTHPSISLCLNTGRLTAAQKKTKWYQTLPQQGCISIWPLNSQQYQQWAKLTAQRQGLTLSTHAFDQLSQLTLSDPKATSDLLKKLSLMYLEHEIIHPKQLHLAYAHHSSSSTFDLIDATLCGQTELAFKHFESLKMQPQIAIALWGLFNHTLKQLLQAQPALSQGQSITQVVRTLSRNPKEQARLNPALKRLTPSSLEHIQSQLWSLELSIKGLIPLEPLHIVKEIILQYSRPHHV
tara:strand:+ start:61 stop:1086 length:1026 start_codon:yes stop_codon:yes gene_type:complete